MAAKNMHPLISVIIPVFNREKFIAETISSVLNQDFEDYEIIIVDDGSTDNTAKAIKSFKDARIRYRFQRNRGRSNARNKAIELSRGKYLAFLDSDDLFLPGKLKKQVQYLEENPDYAMVYTSAYTVDSHGKKCRHIYEADREGYIYEHVAFYIPTVILLPTVLVRKCVVESVGGFDEKMCRFEDTDLWRRISKRFLIKAFKEPLCKIRTHEGNQMEHPSKLFNSVVYYINKISEEDSDKSKFLFRRKSASLFAYYAMALAYSENAENRSYVKTFLTKSVRYNPFQIAAYYFVIIPFPRQDPLVNVFIKFKNLLKK